MAHSPKPSASKPPFQSSDHFFIKRVGDGSCAFLCNDANNYYCGLQNMKPEACKIWPFKVFSEPKYGEAKTGSLRLPRHAIVRLWRHHVQRLALRRAHMGFPALTVKEFTEIALGVREMQCKSTRPVAYRPAAMGKKTVPLNVTFCLIDWIKFLSCSYPLTN